MPSWPNDRELRWCCLTTEFEPRLRGWLRRGIGNHDEVDDLIAEVWTAAMEHEGALFASADPWPILRDVMRRVWADHMRRFRHAESLVRLADSDGNGTLDEDTDAGSGGDWVSKALLTLPYKERWAVDFRYRWNMPYWAVAAGISTSEAGARVAVSRGLKRLRALAPRPPEA